MSNVINEVKQTAHTAELVAEIYKLRKERNAVFYKVTDRVFADVCRTVCVHIAGGIDARAPLREELLAFVEQH